METVTFWVVALIMANHPGDMTYLEITGITRCRSNA
jgi:hypothetical protein